MFEIFNETLTKFVISFEQLDPESKVCCEMKKFVVDSYEGCLADAVLESVHDI